MIVFGAGARYSGRLKCKLNLLSNLTRFGSEHLFLLLAGPISRTHIQCKDFVDIFNILLDLSAVHSAHFFSGHGAFSAYSCYLCYSIAEFCNLFTEVK